MTALPLCPTCRALGECRLGVGPPDVDPPAETVLVPVRCPAAQAGGPRIAHGGWTAAVFDDVLGRLLGALGHPVVTAELTVRYLRPVPVEVDLHVRVRLMATEGRRHQVAGDLVHPGSEQALASADAVFMTVRADHASRARVEHGPALAVEPCTVESVAAALPEHLRPAFLADHRRVLQTWRTEAEVLRRRPSPPARPAEPPEWAGLMDDWEL